MSNRPYKQGEPTVERKDCNGSGTYRWKSAKGNKCQHTCRTCEGTGWSMNPNAAPPFPDQPMTNEEWLEDLETRVRALEGRFGE